MDIFDFAMKMELDGKAFYEEQAEKASIPGLRTIFSRLASDEQKHYEIFQALKNDRPKVAMESTPALDEARNVFDDLMADKKIMGVLKGDLEGYRFAMKIEADSFRLYEDAAEKEQNAEIKNLLLRIAEEEHKHFTILENIYDFVNAPNQYLAWREFSNRDEFRQFGRDVDLK